MVLYIVDHLISIQQSTLLSAFGTDVNLDYYLSFSLLLSNFHSEKKS